MSLKEEIANFLNDYYLRQYIKDRNSPYNNPMYLIREENVVRTILQESKQNNIQEANKLIEQIDNLIDKEINSIYYINDGKPVSKKQEKERINALKLLKEILKKN